MKSRKNIIALMAVAFLVLIYLPQIITSNYQMRLVNLAGIYMILVLGLYILFGLAGQLSFGQAGFFAIGAYCVGIISVQMGLSPWIGFLAAIIITTLFGIAIGIPTLRLKGHYLIITTVAFAEVIRYVFLNWQKVTRGYDGIGGIKVPSIGSYTLKGEFQIYYAVIFFVILAFFIAWRIKNSTYGRVMVAVKNSEIAAEAMGVNSTQVKVLAFALSSLLSGIAGALYAYDITYINPDSFNFPVSINMVAMLIVGGAGSPIGAVIGAGILTLLPEFLRVSNEYYMLIYGLIFLMIIIFLPKGVYGLLQDGIHRFAKKSLPVKQVPPKLPVKAENEKINNDTGD